MERFAYARSRELGHALEQCTQGARIKGGGTELLAWMKRGLYAPQRLVNITALGGLRGVQREGDTLRIGAATRLSELAATLGSDLPGLREAAELAATPGIRNLGTVAGNLLQENRCLYLHDRLIACPKKGDAKLCPAKQGPNAEHAILGVQNCPSTMSSNLAPMLSALDARLVIARPGEAKGTTHALPLREIWAFEAARAAFASRLPEGGLVLAIELEPKGLHTAHVEFRQKQSYDWATASCAVALRLEGGALRDVRIWLGAVAPVPFRAEAAEKLLQGQAPEASRLEAAARAVTQNAVPLRDNTFKIAMAQHCCRKALELALSRARSV